MQLSRLAADYLRHVGAYRGYSPRTCECYDLAYRQFVAYLMHHGLTDDVRHFTGKAVDGFAHYLAEVGKLRPNSVRIRLSALSSLAKYGMRALDARDRPYLDANPVDRIERPQKQRPHRPFLYREELRALVAVEAAPGEALARDLFLDTGARVSELARANVEDLARTGDGALVLSLVVKGQGRREERVPTPLGAAVGERIMDWLLARNLPAGPEPLLVNREGRRYTRSTLSEVIARLARRAGITRVRVRAHTLRHTYSVIAHAARVDRAARARMLNHLDQSTLQVYDHVLDAEVAAAREQVRGELARWLGYPGGHNQEAPHQIQEATPSDAPRTSETSDP